MKATLCLVVLALTSCLSAEKIRYDNYKVFSISSANEEQVRVLSTLEQDEFSEYQFWTSPGSKKPIDIQVPPHKLDEFEVLSKKLNLNVQVKIENLQE